MNIVVKTKPTLSAIRGDGEEPLGLEAGAARSWASPVSVG
jgi:hypothetical protein